MCTSLLSTDYLKILDISKFLTHLESYCTFLENSVIRITEKLLNIKLNKIKVKRKSLNTETILFMYLKIQLDIDLKIISLGH